MKTIRVGRRTVALVDPTAQDKYVKHLHDGVEASFDHLCASLLPDTAAVALDVGANIGVTATILSQRLDAGKVYAFEPAPGVYAALATNMRSNGMSNVETINRAVNDCGGEVRFEEDSAYGYISDTGGSVVRAITIDEFVASRGIDRVDFIKIDVEGFEKWVLIGARETLRRFSPTLYIEFNSWRLIAHTQENPIAYAAWLLAEFPYVYLVRGATLVRATSARDLAHDNMALDGCVTDLVLSTREIHPESIPPMPVSQSPPPPKRSLVRRVAGRVARAMR